MKGFCVSRESQSLMRFQYRIGVRREWKIMRNEVLKVDWSQFVDHITVIIAIIIY